MKTCSLLLALLGSAATGWAQEPAPPSATSPAAEVMNFKQTMGFGQAELTTVSGEKSLAYVPLSSLGFALIVPVFKREEDIDKPGAQPLFIDVDNVQIIRTIATGQYLEHMVVKGKQRHQLAVRVLDGPVELFSFTQMPQPASGPMGFQTGREVAAKRQWYVRRQGQLVEVVRGGFTKQMAAYFHDDPVIVEALTSKSIGYDDMKMLVRMYNQHQAPTIEPAK